MVDSTVRPAADDARPVVPVQAVCSVSEGASEALPDAELVEAELLVEDVSIDGMCGVY